MDFKLERWTDCGNGGRIGGAEAQKCMHGGRAWVSRPKEGMVWNLLVPGRKEDHESQIQRAWKAAEALKRDIVEHTGSPRMF